MGNDEEMLSGAPTEDASTSKTDVVTLMPSVGDTVATEHPHKCQAIALIKPE